MTIEIEAEFNTFAFAAIAKTLNKIVLERGVAFPDSGIVVGTALIASGMEGEEVHSASLDLISKSLGIKSLSHIRNGHKRMKVIKESVVELIFHNFSLIIE
jgi:hypothetical protein